MKGFFRLFVIVGLFSLGMSSAHAAALYIDPAFSSLNRADGIKLAVRLDVDEETQECVNAVDAVITYTDNISPEDISIGDSIFNVWVESPVINKEERTITFAGGLPNGYCGRVIGDPRLTNTLVELIFRSPGFAVGGADESSVARVTFQSETTAYLNDGLGTKAQLSLYGAQIDLNKTAGSEVLDPWGDEVSEDIFPPRQFSIDIERIPPEYGKYFATFNSSDKETGIDHYEIIEEPISQLGSFKWGRADAPWITTRSPYQLRDQSLNSVIRVKAVDKAGNEYIATVIPGDDKRSTPIGYFIIGIGSIIILLLLIGIALTMWRARKQKKSSKEASSLDDERKEDETV